MIVSTARLTAWALAAVALFHGCSSDKVPPTLPGAHPPTWMQKASSDFHGQFVLADGTESCEHCHGIGSPGGSAGISCIDCHGPGTSACRSCHGGLDNDTGAPPYGLRGQSADSVLAVGAHTTHLDTTSLGAPVPCKACHVVPVYLLSPPHLDSDRPPGQPLDSIAEVVWDGIADGGGAAWDRTAATCSGTYCHGNFAGGIGANTPVWTAGQAACGSCHDVGADPASLLWKHEYHVGTAGLLCADCHASVVDEQFTVVNPALHVNGVVDTLTRDPDVCAVCHGTGPARCVDCHGGIDNFTGAPPLGLSGETSTTQLAVGAHTSHMEGGSMTDGVDCAQCHIVPQATLDPDHLGLDSIAEMTWGPLAGASSHWNRTAETCSGTYCHGNFAGGDAANTPVWTAAGQAACGSCHDVGSDPSLLLWKHDYHVSTAGLQCADCHASVVDTLLAVVGPALHVNGIVDTLTRDPDVCAVCHGSGPDVCTGCHGGVDNLTGAPPLGLRGETSITQLAVGAHTVHMEGGSLADGFDCSECHKVPQAMIDPDHLGPDSIAEMTWGPLAGSSSQWNRAAETCSGTYCHGTFAGGDGANTPVWTAADQAACGSCHDVGNDPDLLSGRHHKHVADENFDCIECHASVVSRLLVILNRTLHVDGASTVSLLRGGTYQNGSCSGLNNVVCHDSEQW